MGKKENRQNESTVFLMLSFSVQTLAPSSTMSLCYSKSKRKRKTMHDAYICEDRKRRRGKGRRGREMVVRSGEVPAVRLEQVHPDLHLTQSILSDETMKVANDGTCKKTFSQNLLLTRLHARAFSLPAYLPPCHHFILFHS